MLVSGTWFSKVWFAWSDLHCRFLRKLLFTLKVWMMEMHQIVSIEQIPNLTNSSWKIWNWWKVELFLFSFKFFGITKMLLLFLLQTFVCIFRNHKRKSLKKYKIQFEWGVVPTFLKFVKNYLSTGFWLRQTGENPSLKFLILWPYQWTLSYSMCSLKP